MLVNRASFIHLLPIIEVPSIFSCYHQVRWLFLYRVKPRLVKAVPFLLGPSKIKIETFFTNMQFLSLETFLSFHTNQCEERPVLNLLLIYITAEPNHMQNLRGPEDFL